MGGKHETLKAKTKEQLEEKAREWARSMRESGLTDIRRGWDPVRAKKTEDGLWQIIMWAHT
jgi:hypothetical protein